MIYALGHLSGAHINPAVTIGYWSARRIPAREVVPYVLVQCLGAVVASATLRGVLGPAGNMGATLPAVAVESALTVEFLLSFVLMFVIMAVATDERVADGFCVMMGGPLTGASMNPARSFAPAVVGDLWQSHRVYWVAPVTGVIAAARVHDFLHSAEAPRVVPAGVRLGAQGFARACARLGVRRSSKHEDGALVVGGAAGLDPLLD